MRVGVILPLGEESQPGVPLSYADIRSLATRAEDAGLDSVWVYDHLLGESTEDASASPWEAWTVMSALADATSRVRIGALVLCTAFRPPAVLARMADTLQEISGGRVVLGLGAGWHEPEFQAFGLPFDHRVGRFAEALEIITTMLRTGRASVSGRFHHAADAPVRIRPDRTGPEVLVAGVRPRMLRLTAEYADSWNLAWFGLPGDRFREANAALTAACQEIGRDPATLARTAGIRIAAPGGQTANPDGDDQDPARVIRGDADQIADAFAAWESEGVSELICWPEPSEAASIDLVADALARYRAR
ncbi:LLM class flavin-dependent oxidoreductase [Actinopolymorpha sp. B9G3]|uniref:LLM class flavin-dependent oxidoreductase n=1 Tax=unclassified Actinopolymorpha TaxID=2627063 RepID=UPI0032D8D9E3